MTRRASTPLDVLPDRKFMTAAEAKQARILAWSEKELQENVVEMAQALGWRVYHTYDSRRSQPGFPDLVMIHPQRSAVLWCELKSERGTLSKAQREWLRDLLKVGQNAQVWRPRDVLSGLVHETLAGRR